MKDYIKNEEFFLIDVYAVFEPYFASKESLLLKYNEIDSINKKNAFLRTTSRYFYLVKSVDFSCSSRPDIDTNFISETYKFIAIIVLIESLYSEEEYIDFYQWLMRNDKIPLMTEEEATIAYKQYKKEFGSRKCTDQFLSSLDDDVKSYIQSSIHRQSTINNSNTLFDEVASIKALSSLLYQIRSDFIHKADYVDEFSGSATLTIREKKPHSFEIPLSNLCRIFELGVLRFFDIVPEIKPELESNIGFLPE